MLKWTGSGGKFKFPSEPVFFFVLITPSQVIFTKADLHNH